MSISEESIQTQIPYYLTQKAKQGLVEALRGFPEKTNYFTTLYKEKILQGDGWNKLEVLNFEDGKRKEIKGIILSNSCDISSENHLDFYVNLTFAPVIKLENFKTKLLSEGIDPRKIEAKLQSIREQKVSSLFFLPQGGSLDADYIALFDDIPLLSHSFTAGITDRSASCFPALAG